MKTSLFILIYFAVSFFSFSALCGDISVGFIYERHECDGQDRDLESPSILVSSYNKNIPRNIRQGILNTDRRLIRLYPLLKEVTSTHQIKVDNKKMEQSLGSNHSYFTVVKGDHCRTKEVCSISLQTSDGTRARRMIQCSTSSAAYMYGEVRSLILGHLNRAEEQRKTADKELSRATDHDLAHGGAL